MKQSGVYLVHSPTGHLSSPVNEGESVEKRKGRSYQPPTIPFDIISIASTAIERISTMTANGIRLDLEFSSVTQPVPS